MKKLLLHLQPIKKKKKRKYFRKKYFEKNILENI